MRYLLWLKETDLSQINHVGGKNASLGEMIQNLSKNWLGQKSIPDLLYKARKLYPAQVPENIKPKAILVPHAGLQYSGLCAASAYLSNDPLLLGSLKGQDVGKVFIILTIIYGCVVELGIRLFGLSSVFSLSSLFS